MLLTRFSPARGYQPSHVYLSMIVSGRELMRHFVRHAPCGHARIEPVPVPSCFRNCTHFFPGNAFFTRFRFSRFRRRDPGFRGLTKPIFCEDECGPNWSSPCRVCFSVCFFVCRQRDRIWLHGLDRTTAIQAWAVARGKSVTYVHKGQHPLTEHYRCVAYLSQL